MSRENVEIVRRGYDHFLATGEFPADDIASDFVWDMSTFRNWPEEQTYSGVEGAQRFLQTWLEAWEDWQLEWESVHDAGDKVIVVARQHGLSRTTGMPIDMTFAQIFTLRDGKQVRMEMYADPSEAFEAAGLTH